VAKGSDTPEPDGESIRILFSELRPGDVLVSWWGEETMVTVVGPVFGGRYIRALRADGTKVDLGVSGTTWDNVYVRVLRAPA
jgi:hypothetical protein